MENSPNRIHRPFILQFAILLLVSLIAIYQLGNIPSEGSLLWGITFQRLLLLLFLALSFVISGLGLLVAFRNPDSLAVQIKRFRTRRVLLEITLFITTLLGVCAWLLLWKPVEDAGRFIYYLERLKPILLVITAWSAIITFTLLQLRRKRNTENQNRRLALERNQAVIVSFISILSIALFVVVTGVGITDDGTLWKMPGVPVLITPVTIALFFLVWLMHWTKDWIQKQNAWKPLDWVILLVLVIATAVWWVLTPQVFSTYSPGPYPPNAEAYPFTDATSYDQSAIYAVVGEGLGNGKYVDKPFYATFLTALHTVAGIETYTLMANLQAALFAVFAGLLYLLGFRLHTRYAGLLVAIFGAIWGRNMIAVTNLINTGSPKLFMTEFFSGIVLLIITILTVTYFQKRSITKLVSIGAIASVAVLVRFNFLVFPPLLFGFILCRNWQDKQNRWQHSLIFLIAFLVFLSPWVIRDFVKLGEVPIINNVIVRSIERLFETSPGFQTVLPRLAGGILNPISGFTQNNAAVQAVSEPFQDSIPVIVANHALHNIFCAFLTLPRSFSTASLQTVIKAENSLWQVDHTLHFSGIEILWMLFHGLILSIGIGTAWKKQRWTGLLPPIAMTAYSFGLGVARTSGDRYITPIVWVIFLYWGIGMVEILLALLRIQIDVVRSPQHQALKESWWEIGLMCIVLLVIAASPVWIDWIYPEKMVEPAYEDFVEAMAQEFQSAGYRITANEIKKFIHLEESVYRYGLIYAPRWFGNGDGIEHPFGIYVAKPFDRLAFEFLGKEYRYNAYLPIRGDSLLPIPHGGQAIYLACRREDIDYVVAVTILEDSGANSFYIREAFDGLNCDFSP